MSIFAGTGAGSKPGLEIWRIENLKPVLVDPAEHGDFHTGDCYLVLRSYNKPGSHKLDADLHYWIGSESSQDEQGAVAYRAVELDDFLHGVPVQHREVQGHESPLFLAIFPSGIRYSEGGAESGFRHVDPNAYTARLFHLKGKRNVRSVQVELSARQLNEGDVFLLDTGKTIYQWNGSKANRQEKFKGLELATAIKDKERGGKAKLVFLESGQQGPEVDAFFALLKGTPADVQSEEHGGADDAHKAEPASLWRISDASGSLEITEVGRGRLEKSMLDENDVFLLDGGGEVFIWVGKGATKQERSKGMEYAAEYLKTHNRPEWTPLTRLPGGGESASFKSFFIQFDKEHQPRNDEEAYVARERKQVMGALLEKQKVAEQKLFAGGKVTVWRIENLKRVPVDESLYGQFSSGDSYIVLYKYRNGNRDSYILYFWQGRDSSTDEKTAAALLTVELAAEMQDLPGTQVRVVQNKEPNQFLHLFQGKMIVRRGGVAGSGGFAKQDGSASSSSGEGVHLFHIRGTSAIDTRAVEVTAAASSLNSGDVFVLLTPGHVWAWLGAGSNADERSVAGSLAEKVLAQGRSVETVNEGSEPAEFWDALGEQGPYANEKHLQQSPAEARLFHVNGVTGDFVVEEIHSFTQDDLTQDSVFLLDTVAEVSVWVGKNARPADQVAAAEMALKYIEQAPDGRSPETPVFRIAAGAEPPTFTAYFLGWSADKAVDFSDKYAERVKLLRNDPSNAASPKAGSAPSASSSASSSAAGKTVPALASPAAKAPVAAASPAAAVSKPAAVAPAPAVASSGGAGANPPGPTFPWAELKAGCPAGVVASRKEDALSNEEFKQALGTDRESFAKLAGWKQADLKKKAGIF